MHVSARTCVCCDKHQKRPAARNLITQSLDLLASITIIMDHDTALLNYIYLRRTLRLIIVFGPTSHDVCA